MKRAKGSGVTSGIYAIVNAYAPKGHQDSYVGSAVNIAERWSQHRRDLRRGVHHSIRLRNAWNKYGEGSFVWLVLEKDVPLEGLLAREQRWLDLAKEGVTSSLAFRYNICRVAGNKLGVTPRPETRARIGAASRAWWASLTQDERATHAAKTSAAGLKPVRHGTLGGYEVELGRGLTVCAACKTAYLLYLREYRARPGRREAKKASASASYAANRDALNARRRDLVAVRAR